MKKVITTVLIFYSVCLNAQISNHNEYLFYVGIYNKAFDACETQKRGKKYIRPDEVNINLIRKNDTTRIIPFKYYSIEYPIKNCILEFKYKTHKITFPANKYINQVMSQEREVYLLIYIPPNYEEEKYYITYDKAISWVESFGNEKAKNHINFEFTPSLYDYIYLRIW